MKKLLCILLAVMLVVSSAAIATSAYSWDDPDIWTVDEALFMWELDWGEMPETNRYYFLMPDGTNGDLGDDASVDADGNPLGHDGEFAPTWYIPMNDGSLSTSTAGIYWWESGVADPAAWIGYLPSGEDESDPNVYYADVPKAVTTIVWNNAVDGGMDDSLEIYFKAAQTVNIPCEYYDPGESPNYPDGTESFDNMIFVIDPDLISINDLSNKQTCGGEWYYYYGNGCYGFTKDGSEADCLRDDHHDAEGNHVVPDTQKPTAAPTEEPTDPTEEPTAEPTDPTEEPTAEPTDPTEEPTAEPTDPTEEPTAEPTDPTEEPTAEPTDPTEEPTAEPTDPTEEPTDPPVDPTEPTQEPTTEEPTTEPVVHTYTVAGAIAPGHTNAGCLGTAWDPSNTANDLVLDEATGIWSITYTDVAATVETEDYDDEWYEYKVVQDHGWDVSYTEEGEMLGEGTNAKFDVDVDGSTVTIYFDGTKCWAEVVAPEVPSDPTEDPSTEDPDNGILGDVNGDGNITVMDATAIQMHIAKIEVLTDEQMVRADTLKDGAITVMDATTIQRYLAKLITEF